MANPSTAFAPPAGSANAVPPAPTAPSRRWDWQPKVRWFAAEYLIVVLGVLTAVGINAWWQGRQDAAMEATYLRQLAADLRETERQIAEIDSALVPIDGAAVSFVRAYYQAERPPADSLLVWRHRANWVEVYRPVVSTAEALVATGDLTLMRDDSLRSEITAYLEAMRMETETQVAMGDYIIRAVETINQRLPFSEARRASMTDAEIDSLARMRLSFNMPEGPLQRPFPVDPDALYRDRQLLAAAENFAGGKSALARGRQTMLAATQALRARVDALVDP